jgi:hypothetical protein
MDTMKTKIMGNVSGDVSGRKIMDHVMQIFRA